jgi:type I restriction enzyme R subunit
MADYVTESTVEEAALGWFADLGYQVRHGADIAPEAPGAERAGYGDVVLVERLRAALARINPAVPAGAREEALRKLLHPGHPGLIANNRQVHRWLTAGVDVEVPRPDGTTAGIKVWPLAFDDPAANDWLVVNQFTVVEQKRTRRPDVVVFVNGLPLGLIELKNPADAKATLEGAFNQIGTYQSDIPGLFPYNAVCVISDGLSARAGTLTADWGRFLPWRRLEGETPASAGEVELQVLVAGMFAPARLLDLVRHFVVFEDDGAVVRKKLAAYHQYGAVSKAVGATVAAAGPGGDRRVGVVWHTQGSGKSLSMVFYAGKIIAHPALANPTLVVLTDRNDLDEQLFGTFAGCAELLRQTPVQATDREHLQALLRVAAGGVIFTTIQKFLPSEKGGRYPCLSERSNIVVIADEAHRSQYDFVDGFARHLRDALPHASYIGFTGTPIEAADRSTPAVFGGYIDIYDIQQAVADGATVPIYYEGRLAKLQLDAAERPQIDPHFEEVTEGEELEQKERLKSKWAHLEALVGARKRVGLVAADIVAHFERRQEALEGKGLVVCMSRRICVDLYDAIVALRPEWHSTDDTQGAIKIVMTGSAADKGEWQPHIRSKARREALARRLKDPADPLKLVIVRDMWLTGFDAPPLHTMYVDKPMRGHGLMQAIARVNRVFKDKPGGLIVDYLGLADFLRQALADYTVGDRAQAGVPQEQAVAVLQEKYEVVRALLHGFSYAAFLTGTPAQRLAVIPQAAEHLLQQEQGKARFVAATQALGRAFALAVPNERALALRDDLAFFQAVRAFLVKTTTPAGQSPEALDSAIQQIVSQAVAPAGIVDIFAAAGLRAPDVSIFSDEFLTEIRALPQQNLAVAVLHKLLADRIAAGSRKNVVQARSFAGLLEAAIRQYETRSLEAAAVITELIALAKELRAAQQRGEALGLSEDEVAFYDALAANDSAVQVLGDGTLRTLARELVAAVHQNVTVDWTVRESARARLRVLVKRLLRRYGYPPDQQERATQLVLEQAAVLGKDWVG